MAAPPREPDPVDARRDRRDLRAAPVAVAAAAGRHAARRRAGADAGGAGRLARRVRGARRRPRIARRRTPPPKRAARAGRWPATIRSSRRSRGCCCRSPTRCGCSTCRTRSGGCWCRGRCSRVLVSSAALAAHQLGLTRWRFAAQAAFYGLAGARRLARRARRGRPRDAVRQQAAGGARQGGEMILRSSAPRGSRSRS